MKTRMDADGREYYLKEGEIHYLDEEEEDEKPKRGNPSNSRAVNGAIVVTGILVVAVLLIAAAVIVGNRAVTSSSVAAQPSPDINLFRTQVALEQTQTAIARPTNTPFPTLNLSLDLTATAFIKTATALASPPTTTPSATLTDTPPPAPTQPVGLTETALVQTITALAPTATVPTVAPASSNGSGEQLTVPYDKAADTCTASTYQNTVTLNISGNGQASGAEWSDAFYLYQRADGTAYNPPQLGMFDLLIDGQRAVDTLKLRKNPPPFSSDHTYTVNYDVGSNPRGVCFHVADKNLGDNTGEFHITVQPV